MFKNRIMKLASLAGLSTIVLLIGSCVPAGDEGGSTGFDWATIGAMVVIFVAFYFILIRPQRKKQKEQQAMVSQLKKGVKIVTAGGIWGTIESTSDDSVVIKIESGATMRISRSSIASQR